MDERVRFHLLDWSDLWILSLVLRLGSLFVLGFVVASAVFDLLTRAVGYARLFTKTKFGSLNAIAISIVSAALAGAIIGGPFMNFTTPTAVVAFAGLHAVGGLIGGAIGAGYSVFHLADVGNPFVLAWRLTYSQP